MCSATGLAEWSLAQQRKQAVAPSLLADEAKPGLISTATGLPIIPKAEHNDLSGYRSHLRSFFKSAVSEGFKIDQDCAWPQLTAQPDRRVGVVGLPDDLDPRLTRKEEFEAAADGAIGTD